MKIFLILKNKVNPCTPVVASGFPVNDIVVLLIRKLLRGAIAIVIQIITFAISVYWFRFTIAVHGSGSKNFFVIDIAIIVPSIVMMFLHLCVTSIEMFHILYPYL